MASSGAGGQPRPPPTAAGPPVSASQSPAAGPWWSNMSQHLRQGLNNLHQHAQQLSTQVQVASKNWKAPDLSQGLGMKVDVDFLNPAITGLKQHWQQLPEPVREVLPYAGVAFVASISVRHLYQEQLQESHQRYGQLKNDHSELQQQFKQLQTQLDDINTKRTGAHLEIQMAEAVARQLVLQQRQQQQLQQQRQHAQTQITQSADSTSTEAACATPQQRFFSQHECSSLTAAAAHVDRETQPWMRYHSWAVSTNRDPGFKQHSAVFKPGIT